MSVSPWKQEYEKRKRTEARKELDKAGGVLRSNTRPTSNCLLLFLLLILVLRTP